MEARMLRALARTSATLAAMRILVVAAAARVGRPAARSEPWMAPRQAARSAACSERRPRLPVDAKVVERLEDAAAVGHQLASRWPLGGDP